MKILFFTDVHSSSDKEDSFRYYVASLDGLMKKFSKILEKSKECDVLVCCGDLSVFSSGLENSMMMLKKAKKKVLIIHGNHEDQEDVERLCDGKNLIFMHKKVLTIDDVTFAGYGGDGFSERDLGLEKWAKDAKNKINGKFVFFTHAPPYNTKLDNLPGWGHRGSKSVRDSIEILQPDLFASGHFHETFLKQDKIKKTKLINPGDEGIIVEI